MPISPTFIAELIGGIAGTALLCHAGNKALSWFIDRQQTVEYDVRLDNVDPLSPEPFVDATPTQDPAPQLCARCNKPITATPHYTTTSGPFHGMCLLDHVDDGGRAA